MRIVSWLLLVGCSDGDAAIKESAKQVVLEAFQSADRGGPVGVEVVGKGVWWKSAAIDDDCLREKQIAFRDPQPGGGGRFSPTYAEQTVFQASTDDGFCVYVGDDLSIEIDEVSQYDGAWVVDVVFGIGKPGKWWECLDPVQQKRPVRLAQSDDGAFSIETEPALFGGACPKPLTLVNLQRKGSAPPNSPPSSAPSLRDVVVAAKRVDDALWEGDLKAAAEATACYNLYEKNKFGSCSAAEFANVGPITRGELRRRDGPPWTNNAFTSLDEIQRPKRDRKDPTLFHSVVSPGGLKKAKRTISIQWVDGAWKLVGLVQRKAEGLTSVEYVTDLGRNDARDIFGRRLEGEDIDHRGLPPLKDEDVF